MANFETVPDDIVFYIASLLGKASRISLLRTCKRLRDSMMPVVYRRVVVGGFKARQLSLTVLMSASRKIKYGRIIKSFDFTGNKGLSEMYMTYPLVVDALREMPNLRYLTLSIPQTHAAYFSKLLKTKGIVRERSSNSIILQKIVEGRLPTSPYSLPCLSSLTLEGSIDFVALATNREIEQLTLKGRLQIKGLGVVLDSIDCRILTNLNISIWAVTTLQLIMVIYLVGENCDSLMKLVVDADTFNALVIMISVSPVVHNSYILKELSDAIACGAKVFHKLKTLALNADDDRMPVFLRNEYECHRRQLIHLQKASSFMENIEDISFGPVVWKYLTLSDGDGVWKSEFFESEQWRDAVGDSDSGGYSCIYSFDEEKKRV